MVRYSALCRGKYNFSPAQFPELRDHKGRIFDCKQTENFSLVRMIRRGLPKLYQQ